MKVICITGELILIKMHILSELQIFLVPNISLTDLVHDLVHFYIWLNLTFPFSLIKMDLKTFKQASRQYTAAT